MQGHGQLQNQASSVSKRLAFTFRSVSVPKGTDDLPDAVLRADAVRSHVSPFDNLCCNDVCLCGFYNEN